MEEFWKGKCWFYAFIMPPFIWVSNYLLFCLFLPSASSELKCYAQPLRIVLCFLSAGSYGPGGVLSYFEGEGAGVVVVVVVPRPKSIFSLFCQN